MQCWKSNIDVRSNREKFKIAITIKWQNTHLINKKYIVLFRVPISFSPAFGTFQP